MVILLPISRRILMSNQEKHQPVNSKQPLYYGYIIVIVSFIILMVSLGLFFSFGVFFKPLLLEFGLDRAATSSIVSLCMIMTGLLGIVMGRVNDKLGPRIVLTFCGLLIGIGYLLMSKVSDVWHLYLVYGLLLGVGLSGMMVPLMSTIARWFAKKRSTMTGIVLSGVGTGIFILPPVVSRLVSLYDWRTAYLIMGVITLVVIVLAAQFLRRDPSAIKQPGNIDGNNYEHELTVGTEGLSLKDAFQTRQFWFALVLFFFLGFCRFTITVHIIPHAIEMGLSAISAANVLATIGGASIIARPSIGVLADKIGNRRMFIIGFVLTLLAFVLLIPAKMVWMLFSIAILISVNYGLTAAESPLVAGLFGLKALGIIFGVVGLGYTIGASLGPLLAGYIYDTTDSYTFAFLLCAVLSTIGILISLLLKPVGENASVSKTI